MSASARPFVSALPGLHAADEAASRLLDIEASEASSKLKEALSMVQVTVSDMREGLREAVSQLHSAVGALNTRVMTTETEIMSLRRQLEGGQEKAFSKLQEVTNSIGHFHTAVNGCRDEIRDSKQDIEKFRDMMAVTINNEYGTTLNRVMQDLSQFRDETKIEYEELMKNHQKNEQRHSDPSGFEKHITNVINKLESDSRFHGELARDSRDRVERMDAQMNGLHARLYEMANDLILLKDKSSLPVSSVHSTRQHFFPLREAPPNLLKGDVEGKVRQMSPSPRLIEPSKIHPEPCTLFGKEEKLRQEPVTPQVENFRTATEQVIVRSSSPNLVMPNIDLAPFPPQSPSRRHSPLTHAPLSKIVESQSTSLEVAVAPQGTSLEPLPGQPIGLDPITGLPMYSPGASGGESSQHEKIDQISVPDSVRSTSQLIVESAAIVGTAAKVLLSQTLSGTGPAESQTQQSLDGRQSPPLPTRRGAPARILSGSCVDLAAQHSMSPPPMTASSVVGASSTPRIGQAWGPRRGASPSTSPTTATTRAPFLAGTSSAPTPPPPVFSNLVVNSREGAPADPPAIIFPSSP